MINEMEIASKKESIKRRYSHLRYAFEAIIEQESSLLAHGNHANKVLWEDGFRKGYHLALERMERMELNMADRK